MTSPERQDGGTFDRRIGRRAGVRALVVTWVAPRRRRRSWRRAPVEAPGRVVNVSLTGAAITAPADLAIEPGQIVVIRHEGQDSQVRIRRRQATDDPGEVLVGAEFVTLGAELEDRVTRAVTEAGPGPG